MKLNLTKKAVASKKKSVKKIVLNLHAAKRLKKPAKVVKKLVAKLSRAKKAVAKAVHTVSVLKKSLPKTSTKVKKVTSTTKITSSTATSVVTTTVVEVVRVVEVVETVVSSFISEQQKRLESIAITKAQTVSKLKTATKKHNAKVIAKCHKKLVAIKRNT